MGQQASKNKLIEFKFDFDKFLAVVHYFAYRPVPELTKYKVIKLEYLADKYHAVKYGRPIVGDRYCALQYGPVPSSSLDWLNNLLKDPSSSDERIRRMNGLLKIDRTFQNPRFSSDKTPDLIDLSKSDIGALDHVIEHFGSKDFEELHSITANTYAYRTVWNGSSANMRYEDFFEEDSNALAGALEEMIENSAIRQAFSVK